MKERRGQRTRGNSESRGRGGEERGETRCETDGQRSPRGDRKRAKKKGYVIYCLKEMPINEFVRKFILNNFHDDYFI